MTIHEVTLKYDSESMRHKVLIVLFEEIRNLELLHNEVDKRAEAAEARVRRLQLEEDAALTKWREAEARGAEVYDQLQDARRRITAALDLHTTCRIEPLCPTCRALTEGTGR